MAKKVGEQLFDVRTVDRHVLTGLITRKDYEKFVAGLEDSASFAVDSDVRMAFDSARRRDDRAITTETTEED